MKILTEGTSLCGVHNKFIIQYFSEVQNVSYQHAKRQEPTKIPEQLSDGREGIGMISCLCQKKTKVGILLRSFGGT